MADRSEIREDAERALSEARGVTFTATKLHEPGRFDLEGWKRSELGIRMLCAWNNVPRDQAPAFWSLHANDATVLAWCRVAKAVRDFDAEQINTASHSPHPLKADPSNTGTD